MPFFIVCKHCEQRFESRYSQKLFCTRECYQKSPQFQAMLRENSKKVAAATLAASQNGVTTRQVINCLNCNAEVFTKPSRNKSTLHKYCSRKCYREYMAGRFDRYIASPESLALPQNYDEFLTGDELRCLIEGCGWSGVQLSSHMNFAHGIQKHKFKELAGFNSSTGVITADYAERLSMAKRGQGWGAEHMAGLRQLIQNPSKPPSGERRLEGKEHAAKARALQEVPVLTFTCHGCGITCSERVHIKKYCSTQCRDRFYLKQNQKKQYPMQCEVCKSTFNGNLYQQQRIENGDVVVCSFFCRQRRAGSIARGVWAGR